MIEPDRSSLEADLERHRQSGDFASQAEALMALAQMAHEEELELTEKNAFPLSHAFYGQAYDAYEKAGDKRGMAMALHRMCYLLNLDTERSENRALYDRTIELYKELGDLKELAEVYVSMERFLDLEIYLWAFERAMACYEELQDRAGQAKALVILSYFYPRDSAEFQIAVNRANALNQQIEDRDEE